MFESYYHSKTILVTGGAGAIGRNLVERLLFLGVKKVIILDDLSSAYQWNIPDHDRILFVKGDIRNDDDLRRVFKMKPSIVFHLAAFFANQNSVDYPLISEDVNVRGTIKLLEYATISGIVERFVYTNSEGGAYGSDCQLPYREENISIRLSSPYYVSKMSAESYCFYYHKNYDLPVTVLRLFNNYGPGEVPGQYRNVIPNFIYWALNNRPLPLTGDDTISRDFVYVDDTVEGLIRAGYFDKAIGEAINIATGKETRIHQLAEEINIITGNAAGVELMGRRKWDDRPVIIGDHSKCEKLLHFKPQSEFKTGLILTIDWFKRNWNEIVSSADFQPGANPALNDLQSTNGYLYSH